MPERLRWRVALALRVLSLATLSLIVLTLSLLAAQSGSEPAAGTWTVPRTSSGQPDLQGVWDFATITPLERPAEFAGKELLTAEESATYEAERFVLVDHDTDVGAESVCEGTGNYNEFWYDRGYGDRVGIRRTSLIVDPPDGRIPPRTEEAQWRPGAQSAGRSADSWTDRSLGERCMLGFNQGPPMMPSAYNNYVQLIQGPDQVVIYNEMVHDARIVPMNGSAHLSDSIRQWTGDSRGRWDGDTLVVETTNFIDMTSFSGWTDQLRLTERFTRVDADTLHYEFTIDDPSTFVQPWTALVPMTRSDGVIYEYACHERNYGMEGILAGARAEELD